MSIYKVQIATDRGDNRPHWMVQDSDDNITWGNEVHQVGDAVIFELKLVRAAALQMMRTEVLDKPMLSSWQQVIDYCRAAMGYETREQFRILFLDKKNKGSSTN